MHVFDRANACADRFVCYTHLRTGGAPFSVREVEPVFAERKPAARKSKKARQVAAVPDNAGELAMEMVQWLVRRGLLQLMRLGPPVEHSAKLASGLGAVDHDDL